MIQSLYVSVCRMAENGNTARRVKNVWNHVRKLLQIYSVDRDKGTVSMMTYYPVCLFKYFLLSAWRHCQSCGRCALPDHPCGRAQGQEGCFNCGSLEHKRKVCPLKDTHRVGRWAHKTLAVEDKSFLILYICRNQPVSVSLFQAWVQ